jgi:membrane protein implicated in regulation of membrane protease activity
LANRLTLRHLSLETLLLAGFLWLCVAPLISVVVLPWMGALPAIAVAAFALVVAYGAAEALTASTLQPTPESVAERLQPNRSRSEMRNGRQDRQRRSSCSPKPAV